MKSVNMPWGIVIRIIHLVQIEGPLEKSIKFQCPLNVLDKFTLSMNFEDVKCLVLFECNARWFGSLLPGDVDEHG